MWSLVDGNLLFCATISAASDSRLMFASATPAFRTIGPSLIARSQTTCMHAAALFSLSATIRWTLAQKARHPRGQHHQRGGHGCRESWFGENCSTTGHLYSRAADPLSVHPRRALSKVCTIWGPGHATCAEAEEAPVERHEHIKTNTHGFQHTDAENNGTRKLETSNTTRRKVVFALFRNSTLGSDDGGGCTCSTIQSTSAQKPISLT